MSHIFDALQRSESELSGTEASSFSVATELLQAAEEKMRAAAGNERPGRTALEFPGLEPRGFEPPSLEPPSTEQPGLDRSNSSRSGDQYPSFPADLEQCPSLSVVIAPGSRLVSIEKEESLGAEKFRFLAVRLRQLRKV